MQTAYAEWQEEQLAKFPEYHFQEFSIDDYMNELSSNYGKNSYSTDFYFYDSDNERVFAKNLQEYDGSTLQYIGFMPKNDDLGTYISGMTAEKASEIISNLKDSSVVENYKEGVVTKLHTFIPFFKFEYTMDDLKDNLIELGIVDVFDEDRANLSEMVDLSNTANNASILDAMHKADIDFSNDGIKAAAATSVSGGMGAGGPDFDYEWDVPVEEIDLTFNKPFFFIIRDKDTGEVWFTGKVYNPAG